MYMLFQLSRFILAAVFLFPLYAISGEQVANESKASANPLPEQQLNELYIKLYEAFFRRDADTVESVLLLPDEKTKKQLRDFLASIASNPNMEPRRKPDVRVGAAEPIPSIGQLMVCFLVRTKEDTYFLSVVPVSLTDPKSPKFIIPNPIATFSGVTTNLSASQQAIENLNDELLQWKELEGEALQQKAAEYCSRLRVRLLALEYAERNGIPVTSCSQLIQLQKTIIAEVTGLPPAELKKQIIRKIEEGLEHIRKLEIGQKQQAPSATTEPNGK